MSRSSSKLVGQRVGDGVAVFADPHETQPQQDFALAVGRDQTAPEFVADDDLGHVLDVDRHALERGDLNVADLRPC